MKKKYSVVIAFIFTLLLLSGCAATSATQSVEIAPMQPEVYGESYEESKDYTSGTTVVDADTITVAESGGEWSGDSVTSQDENIVLGERMVIKNADLSIIVDSPADKMEDIKLIASNLGGYVSASYLYKRTTSNNVSVPEATITIRVPAESLDTALLKVKALVSDPETDILSENITSQDITKEYTDLNSNLENLKSAEEQLKTIMDQAYKTEDVLSVYNNLTEVRGQIEVIQGQINYYKDATAYSSIAISLVAQESIEPLTVGGWTPVGVMQDALQALVNALKFFVNAAIWIILFIVPVLIIIAIPFFIIFLIVRAIVRKNKAKRSVSFVKEPETTKTSEQ